MRLVFAIPLFLATFAILPLHATSTGNPTEAEIYTADGFDYPVAKPNAIGYYKSRGWFRYHPGEDWVGLKGPNTILGAPVYSIGGGIVVFTRNAPGGWGNVVIVRHAYYEGGKLNLIDSFYAHLRRVIVREGQSVAKGQQMGEIGTNRGMYHAHLHLEVRKNLLIGINRSGYSKNFGNYWIPTNFIEAHRKLEGWGRRVKVAVAPFEFQTEFPFPIDEFRGRQGGAAAGQKKSTETEKSRSLPAKRSFRVNRFDDLNSL